MRKLITRDLFEAVRIVKREGVREHLKKAVNVTADLRSVGMDVIFTIFECFAEENAENAIYNFLSAPWEMPAEEIGNLTLVELKEKLKEFGEMNDLESFFSQLSDLTSTN